MNILFKKLQLDNFMSFKHAEFDFSELKDQIILVTGRNEDISEEDSRNGAGKTTIFNGLLYAIYGEMIQTPKNSHIAHWKSLPNEDVKVQLTLSVDNTNYEICRFLKGSKKTGEVRVWVESTDGNMEELTRSSMEETNTLIQTRIVPCGKSGFLRCVFLTADKDYNFFELNKKDRNEFLESLFDLKVYNLIYNDVKVDRNKISNDVKADSLALDSLKSSINKIQETEEQKKVANLETINNKLQNSKNELKEFDEKNNVEKIIKNNKTELIFKSIYEQKTAIESEKNKIEKRIIDGNKAIREKQNELYDLKNKQSKNENCINSNIAYIKKLDNIILKHHTMTDDFCKDCAEKYNKKVKIEDIENEKAELINKNDDLNKINSKLNSDISNINNLIKKYDNSIQSFELSKKKYDEDIKKLNEQILTLRDERRTLISNIRSYENQINDCKHLFTESYDSSLISLQEQYKERENSLIQNKNKEKQLLTLEQIIKPENIREKIVPDMLKELNFRISGYLSQMGSNYTFEFDTDFTPIFKSANNKEAEYKQFSSGERMRLSIAASFAFKDFMQVRLNIHSNILIIDEYIDSNLDVLSVNGIMDMIREMVNTEHLSAYIISHRSEILNSYSNTEIIVTKKNMESNITIEQKD